MRSAPKPVEKYVLTGSKGKRRQQTRRGKKREIGERRKVAENDDPKFGKERSRAVGKKGGRVMKIDQEIREKVREGK